jgi:hypothetical protein
MLQSSEGAREGAREGANGDGAPFLNPEVRAVSDRLHYLEYPPVAWGNVRAVYADAGCVLVNPSPHAGTWAVVYVNADGKEIGHAAGYLVPDEGTVENNLMETFAALVGLEVLPDGWAGTCTPTT